MARLDGVWLAALSLEERVCECGLDLQADDVQLKAVEAAG